MSDIIICCLHIRSKLLIITRKVLVDKDPDTSTSLPPFTVTLMLILRAPFFCTSMLRVEAEFEVSSDYLCGLTIARKPVELS